MCPLGRGAATCLPARTCVVLYVFGGVQQLIVRAGLAEIVELLRFSWKMLQDVLEDVDLA